MGETSWSFLLLGSLTAVGAALALGTLAAILRYHRTGAFPGDEERETADVRGRLVALWVRVALGVVLTGVGVWALQRAGVV